MIQINLIPEESKKKPERFKAIDMSRLNIESVPLIKIGAGVGGAIIIIHLILVAISIYAGGSLKTQEKVYNELLPEKKQADALIKEVDTRKKKVNAIDELMVRRFGWSKKLNDLSESMTSGIWFNDLIYDEKMTERTVPVQDKLVKGKVQAKTTVERTTLRYLIITGFASSKGEEGTASIGKFIKSLKANESFYADFKDIELGAIKRDKVQDQEVMSFKITCLFK